MSTPNEAARALENLKEAIAQETRDLAKDNSELKRVEDQLERAEGEVKKLEGAAAPLRDKITDVKQQQAANQAQFRKLANGGH